MPFFVFLAWEIVFQSFWVSILLNHTLPYRESLMAFFNLLMFANGVQHLVWASVTKRYVPGLVTAPLFIVIFLWFFLS